MLAGVHQPSVYIRAPYTFISIITYAFDMEGETEQFEFSLGIWDLFELLTPSSALELQICADPEQTQCERLTGNLCLYTLVVSSLSAYNLCRYIKSKTV